MKKTNLSTEIVSILKQNFNTNKALNITFLKRKNVYEYFLKENIEKIFNKTEFDTDEIDIIYDVNDTIQVESIFGITLDLSFSNPNEIKGFVNGQEVFKIETLGNLIINSCTSQKDNEIEINNYSVDVNKIQYTYYKGQRLDDDSIEYSFGGILNPINMKHGEIEMFELTRLFPAEEKAPSLLRRIVENIKNNRYIRIETSNKLVDTIDYSDKIFDSLKEESIKFSKTDSDIVKKELKKDNE